MEKEIRKKVVQCMVCKKKGFLHSYKKHLMEEHDIDEKEADLNIEALQLIEDILDDALPRRD